MEDGLPYCRAQDKAYERVVKDGFAGTLMDSDKKRERQEKEQELQTQGFLIASAKASMPQSERRLAEIDSDYRRQLHSESNDIQGSSTNWCRT